MKVPDLHRLVMQGDTDGVARLLFGRRVDVDAFDASGKTALMYAAENPNSDTRILELLLQHGAKLALQSRCGYGARGTAIAFAVSGGDPRKVAMLVEAGASIHYRDAHGYDALLYAVHHRDVARDPRLLELLKLLISHGVALDTISSHHESGLRVLSRLGRFDAIKLLLEADAPIEQLQWTALHQATALGAPADMQRLLDDGHASEDRDWWQRTPWLLAILTGDIDKARVLQNYGANVDARGRCGATPLSFAVMGHRPQMLQWLIESGQDVEQQDDFGATALFEASELGDLECASILLEYGADVDHRNHIPQTALGYTFSPAVVKLLLDAGADIRELPREGRRALLGLPRDPDLTALTAVSADEFTRARNRRFGTSNPERIDEPFWHAMIRSGVNGYLAIKAFDGPSSFDGGPVWCAERFGQSITFLEDGRIVQIAGEHEDGYDPDFCIYNDVFVHEPDGCIVIFGYPEPVFPPTDFHTATAIGTHIYVIGSLGYHGTREYGRTPVYRLHTGTYAIERIDCTGEAPGWIYGHTAKLRSPTEIEITSGKIVTADGSDEKHAENQQAFVLDVERRMWRVV
jgi:ankyrin repeat protein